MGARTSAQPSGAAAYVPQEQAEQQQGRDDGGGGEGVVEGEERDEGQLELPERLLHGRDDGPARATALPLHPALLAHAPARVQERQLHEARSICEVLPQPAEGLDPPQPLPSGLPGRCLHLLPRRHRPRAPAALSQRLCEHSEEVLQERLQERQCEGHHHLAVERPSDTKDVRRSFKTGILWFFFKARSDSGALLSAMTPSCARTRASTQCL